VKDSHKTLQVQKVCTELGLSFFGFSYFGWDQSINPDIPPEGERYVAHWLSQAAELLGLVKEKNIIFVGYSMGAPLMLALASMHIKPVAGLIGIAPGFGKEFSVGIPALYGELSIHDLNKTYRMPLGFEGNAYSFTANWDCTAPLRLLLSADDKWVSQQSVSNMMAAYPGHDILLTLRDGDSHRLDTPEDEAWLTDCLKDMAA
jgi:pimeloyl-ACP methyl ester carboxylesterase